MTEYMIVDVDETTALVKRGECSPGDVGPMIGQLFGMIMEENPGIELEGPPCVYYLSWTESNCVIEAAAPVRLGTESKTEVKTYPACRTVMTEVRGPYEGLAHAWSLMWSYIQENGFTPAPNVPWDCYVTNPSETPDPANYLTEIYLPVTIQKL